MNIIVCVDDNNGQLFNGRRQSKDIEVVNKIYEIVSEQKLLINSFSEKLFLDKREVRNDFLEIASENDFCFVENVDVTEYISKINKVYLFRWNRDYPYDFTFDLDLSNNFTLSKVEEFKGNSHDMITLEVWTK